MACCGVIHAAGLNGDAVGGGVLKVKQVIVGDSDKAGGADGEASAGVVGQGVDVGVGSPDGDADRGVGGGALGDLIGRVVNVHKLADQDRL